MRIMYLSAMDSGGQGHLLTKAMREHLGWEAKAFTMQESYLGYPTDWVEGKVSEEEVLDFAKDTDWFIVQDQYVGTGEIRKYITTKNSCIHGLGSPLRARLANQCMNQLRLHTLIIPPAPDPTITQHLLATAFFESLIVDVDRIDELTKGVQQNAELTVCCPVSKKKEKYIEEAREQIESLGVRFETVTRTAWADTIRIKAKAHIILDPPSDDVCPSLNTWEAIYLGSIPVGPYSAWGYSVHPELDYYAMSYNTEMRTNGSIFSAVKDAIKQVKNRNDPTYINFCPAGQNVKFIFENYSADRVVQRWKWWLKWAMMRRV